MVYIYIYTHSIAGVPWIDNSRRSQAHPSFASFQTCRAQRFCISTSTVWRPFSGDLSGVGFFAPSKRSTAFVEGSAVLDQMATKQASSDMKNWNYDKVNLQGFLPLPFLRTSQNKPPKRTRKVPPFHHSNVTIPKNQRMDPTRGLNIKTSIN